MTPFSAGMNSPFINNTFAFIKIFLLFTIEQYNRLLAILLVTEQTIVYLHYKVSKEGCRESIGPNRRNQSLLVGACRRIAQDIQYSVMVHHWLHTESEATCDPVDFV